MSTIKYSKYCAKKSSNIPYYNEYCVNIKSKFVEEGCNQLISYPNKKVYDFDAYIKDKYSEHGTPPQSMDIIFGTRNRYLQAVECRFRITSSKQITKEELKGKMNKTRDEIVSWEMPPPEHMIFLYNENLKERAKRKIKRFFPKTKRQKFQSEVMSSEEFITNFF